MKISDAGVVIRSTRNILFSKVVIGAAVVACSSMWPSVSKAIETGKWSSKDTTAVLAAVGSLAGTVALRYSDDDPDCPTQHTPKWLPGRNKVVESVPLMDRAADILEQFTK